MVRRESLASTLRMDLIGPIPATRRPVRVTRKPGFNPAGHYRRICETLGIERKPKDVTPTLDDIAREIAAEREAAA
jgi:hypothetical protein